MSQRGEALEPGEELLPESYPTEDAANAAAQALGRPYYIKLTVVMPAHEGTTASTRTYQIVRCSAEKAQRKAQDWFEAMRCLWGEPLNAPQMSLNERQRMMGAIIYGLASPWPKPRTPKENQQDETARRHRVRQLERATKTREQAFEAELAACYARKAADDTLVHDAIAQGLASPWKNAPEDQPWRRQERRRMLDEYEAQEHHAQREAQIRQQPERQPFLTREAILGGIACTWRPSIAVLTQIALEQGSAAPWPDPDAAAARQRARTALTPRNMQRLQKIIASHKRRSAP